MSFVSRTPCPCTSAPTHPRHFARGLRGCILPVALLGMLLTAPLSAATLRLATFNLELGVGAPGTTSYEQAKAVIARVNPDVLALVEVQGGADTNNFAALATDLGYAHTLLSSTGVAVLDVSLRTGFFSRHPIVATNWVRSPVGALEMTRQNMAVKIDVPGTPKDPFIVVIHPKCCSSSTRDSFRRAIEMRRTRELVEASTLPAIDNVFVVGDFNLVGSDNAVFNALPTGLPTSYRLGADVTFPVTYRTNPAFYFPGLGLEQVVMAQVNGLTKTWSSRTTSSSVLDYIVASAPVRARGYQTEIYNSTLDVPGAGLPKFGSAPATNASSLASDHFLLFGDFNLGGPDPAPVISWPTASNLAAGQSLGQAVLSGGAGAIPGAFAFAAPATVPPVGTGDWNVIFTPQDQEDYTPVTNPVSVTVQSSHEPSLFEQWAGGDETANLATYALGGASSPTGHDGIPAGTSLEGNLLSFTTIVRTNDPSLVVTAQVASDVTLGPWSTNGVSRTNPADQSGVPGGTVRTIFSVDRGTNSALFLRLEATLQP